MVCPRCGKLVPATAGHCPACGAGIAVGVLTPPFSPNTPVSDDDANFIDQTINSGGDARTIQPDERSAPDASNSQSVPGFGSPTSLTVANTSGAPRTRAGLLTVGQSFGTRYHIIRILGVGGMGAVYQAWDAELGITVAIKVIRPEVSPDATAAAHVERRFKRELILARQVTHKNVVRIHDIGEIDGIKYITMPYVEGSDLANVLREHGRLPIPKTLRIIRSWSRGWPRHMPLVWSIAT